MNDLELMYLLEENDYEPSIENLKILKESSNAQLDTARKVITGEDRRKMSQNTAEATIEKQKAGRNAARVIAQNGGKLNSTALDMMSKGFAAKNKINYERQQDRKMKEKRIMTEKSFSDYELYQILESNGYTTTEKNLSILKEAIDNGEIEILDEASIRTQQRWEDELNNDEISPKRREQLQRKFLKQREKEARKEEKIKKKEKIEESFSDYELYQILESNGYTTTRENLEILKESSNNYFIVNGKIIKESPISDEDWEEMEQEEKDYDEWNERRVRSRAHDTGYRYDENGEVDYDHYDKFGQKVNLHMANVYNHKKLNLPKDKK